MNRHDFKRLVNEAFQPFLINLGFTMGKFKLDGKNYNIHFLSPYYMISISYEVGENEIFVMVFSKQNGEWSNIDDRVDTPRLKDLNQKYMRKITKSQLNKNKNKFNHIIVNTPEEKKLLKAAMELNIVLPLHITQKNGASLSF